MDDFIKNLEDFLKSNKVSKKNNLGYIPPLDQNGHYITENKGKIIKLIKPEFIKEGHHNNAQRNNQYLRSKLLNQYISNLNNYYSNYQLDDIKKDQQKLKDSIYLIEQLNENQDSIDDEISSLRDEIKNLNKQLINLYNSINFGEKEQIKKYLELKMKLDKLIQSEKSAQEKKKNKKVTIQGFKMSSIDTLKIEYLNSKKTILSSNKIKVNYPQKLLKEQSGFKKTQKKIMKGGERFNKSILKKKGSMKNTKNISWTESLGDGTPIIDNSFNDFSDLNETTNIELSSISNNLDNDVHDLDLSQINIIDNKEENLQLGGGITSLNIDDINNGSTGLSHDDVQIGGNSDLDANSTEPTENSNGDSSSFDIHYTDDYNQISIKEDINNLRNNNFISGDSDVINLENKTNIDSSGNQEVPILDRSSDLIGGDISVYNSDESKELESNPKIQNEDSFNTDDENKELESNLEIQNEESFNSDDNMNEYSNDDKIMISFDEDNNIQIDDQTKKETNNSDIKIINLK